MLPRHYQTIFWLGYAEGSILGVGRVATPRFRAGVSWGRRWIVGGRERVVKYYYNNPIMYSKYFRQWRLLKRNKIICTEVAVNGQFCLENRNFLWNCLKKMKCFGYLPGKIKIFGEIIDAAVTTSQDTIGYAVTGESHLHSKICVVIVTANLLVQPNSHS